MTIQARIATQCGSEGYGKGKTGCFLFSGDIKTAPVLHSPVFSDVLELFTWIRENNIPKVGNVDGNPYMPIYEVKEEGRA